MGLVELFHILSSVLSCKEQDMGSQDYTGKVADTVLRRLILWGLGLSLGVGMKVDAFPEENSEGPSSCHFGTAKLNSAALLGIGSGCNWLHLLEAYINFPVDQADYT